MNFKGPTVALAFLIMQAPAFAHDVEKGPNGGQVIDDHGHHVELTAKPDAIVVYLTGDKDAPIASAGAEAQAVIQDNGKSAKIVLAPVEPNMLSGKLDAALNPGAKIVVTAKLADGHSVVARFVAK